jgi:hypothetical protein
MSEEVTTYSGLVRVLRERIAGYVREGVEWARALRELVRLVGEPIEVGGQALEGQRRSRGRRKLDTLLRRQGRRLHICDNGGGRQSQQFILPSATSITCVWGEPNIALRALR